MSGRALGVLSAVLGVVLVLALVVAVWAVLKVRKNDDELKDRSSAVNVASQFALRMDAVDGTDFDAYTKSVNALLTTKAKTKNAPVFKAIKESYQTAKVKGTGKVLLTGIGDADDDSAIVLVVHDASITTSQGDIEHHYRWSIDLAKVNGTWRVDDFTPVN